MRDQLNAPSHTQAALLCKKGAPLKAQVLIVGLGAGGGMAFYELARRGVDVLAVELGGHFDPQLATGREEQMLPELFMDGGARATEDMSITILQGRGVGGSTLHNTNLCKRLPQAILAQWEAEHGLSAMTSDVLQEDFAHVERLLKIHPVPDEQLNANNRIMARGVEALGWRGGRLSHNRDGCRQSGLCELGCPNNGKQNSAKALIPPALAAGGRLLTHTRVERILTQGDEVIGLRCQALDPLSGQPRFDFELRADRVILSASATNSAALVKRSALPDPHRLAGTNLHLHPGAFVAGVFNEPVESWRGVPQAQDCTEHLRLGQEDGGVWLVTGAAHPGAAAGLMPGFGPAHGAFMRQYPNVAISIAMLHDHSSGHVSPTENGEHVRVFYKLNQADRANLLLGLKSAAQIMLAAGAKEVMLPLHPVRMIRSAAQLEQLSVQDIGAFSPPLVAVHPMSTLWMGVDPRRSVVNAQGQHHQVKGLYVADGSLFPTSIGGPPQVPIYTLALGVARAVAHSL